MKKQQIIDQKEISEKNQEVMKDEIFKKARKGSLILAGEETCMEYKGRNEKGRVWSFS
jgi:hypothetical protein